MAHLYDTGGMRRVGLRGRSNILKRLLIHAGAYNLGLIMRRWLGAGTPRGFAALQQGVINLIRLLLASIEVVTVSITELTHPQRLISDPYPRRLALYAIGRRSTGC